MLVDLEWYLDKYIMWSTGDLHRVQFKWFFTTPITVVKGARIPQSFASMIQDVGLRYYTSSKWIGQSREGEDGLKTRTNCGSHAVVLHMCVIVGIFRMRCMSLQIDKDLTWPEQNCSNKAQTYALIRLSVDHSSA